MSVLVLLELLVMVMLPFAIAKMRVGDSTVESADNLAYVCRSAPACTLSHSVMFNSEMVKWLADKFFPWPAKDAPSQTPEEFNRLKSPYPSDPWALQNAGGDYWAMLLQIPAWWLMLLVIVDRRGSKHGVLCYKWFWNKRLTSLASKKESFSQTMQLEGKKVVLQADELQIAEPHAYSILCLVFKRGVTIMEPTSFRVCLGEVAAVLGGSSSGKTSLLQKLADQ